MPHRILIVDDEGRMRALLALHLRDDFDVEAAASGEEALRLLAAQSYDLVVLDILMPERDGRDLCRQIKAQFDVPVMMLTALSGTEEKLEAFSAGADDYVTKPFDARELVARAQALIRRGQSAAGGPDARVADQQPLLRFDDLVVDPSRRTVHIGARAISLTPMEFNLLAHLAAHAGRAMSRESLLQDVWRDAAYAETRTVDSHIKTLREKLGRTRWGKALETVWGVGYKFQPIKDDAGGAADDA